MKVSEIFGSTIQGEGPSAGQKALFLRLAGCNLQCVWCDTPYTWRFSDKQQHNSDVIYLKENEIKTMRPIDVVEELEKVHQFEKILVITGGEPLLQESDVLEVIEIYRNNFYGISRFEIETAGTIFPDKLLRTPTVNYNVSPKLANSNNPLEKRYRPEVLRNFRNTGLAIFKFVVRSEETELKQDLEEIRLIAQDVGIPNHMIWLMAEGATQEEQLANMPIVMQAAIDRQYNFSPRLHTLVWGNKRGV